MNSEKKVENILPSNQHILQLMTFSQSLSSEADLNGRGVPVKVKTESEQTIGSGAGRSSVAGGSVRRGSAFSDRASSAKSVSCWLRQLYSVMEKTMIGTERRWKMPCTKPRCYVNTAACVLVALWTRSHLRCFSFAVALVYSQGML